jgi:hypothetical protein
MGLRVLGSPDGRASLRALSARHRHGRWLVLFQAPPRVERRGWSCRGGGAPAVSAHFADLRRVRGLFTRRQHGSFDDFELRRAVSLRRADRRLHAMEHRARSRLRWQRWPSGTLRLWHSRLRDESRSVHARPSARYRASQKRIRRWFRAHGFWPSDGARGAAAAVVTLERPMVGSSKMKRALSVAKLPLRHEALVAPTLRCYVGGR